MSLVLRSDHRSRVGLRGDHQDCDDVGHAVPDGPVSSASVHPARLRWPLIYPARSVPPGGLGHGHRPFRQVLAPLLRGVLALGWSNAQLHRDQDRAPSGRGRADRFHSRAQKQPLGPGRRAPAERGSERTALPMAEIVQSRTDLFDQTVSSIRSTTIAASRFQPGSGPDHPNAGAFRMCTAPAHVRRPEKRRRCSASVERSFPRAPNNILPIRWRTARHFVAAFV